jgi:hypothetical protein
MFPTTVTDNFFNNPDKIVKYLNTLDFVHKSENYPGIRTDCLSTIDHNLFNSIVMKVLSNYYSDEDLFTTEFQATLVAQKVNEKFPGGWIHSDFPYHMSFVIYLTPNTDINTGTCMYKVKDEYTSYSRWDLLTKYADAKEECYSNPTNENIKRLDGLRLKNNEPFEKTVEVGNVFNRCIAFDSNEYHAQNELTSGDRLTLVGFIKYVSKPYPNTRRTIIHI